MKPAASLRRDVRVFVSAASKELSTVRQFAKLALDQSGCHGVLQEDFAQDYRELVDKLRKEIANCDAVVHIAGLRHGAEPRNRPEGALRRSYTQLEYDIAVELKKPVYVFITGDGFPTEPFPAEDDDARELQLAHRTALSKAGRDYSRPASKEELDQRLRSLQLKVETLSSELTLVDEKVDVGNRRLAWIGAAVATLAVMIAVGFWFLRRESVDATAAEIRRDIAQGILENLELDRNITPEAARQKAIKELKHVKLPREELLRLINERFPEVANDSKAPILERTRAALASGDLDKALELADSHRADTRELAIVEGTAALAKFRKTPNPAYNERALAAFQRAMAASDKAKEPVEWVSAALSAAKVARELNRATEAETLLHQCIEVSRRFEGSNRERLSSSLEEMAYLQVSLERFEAAERFVKEGRAIDEQLYGKRRPMVGRHDFTLANLCARTGRLQDATQFVQRARESFEAGGDELGVGRCDWLHGALLLGAQRFTEAEPVVERARAAYRKTIGEGHAFVADTLLDLGYIKLQTQRDVEAERLFQGALDILEAGRGPNHPSLAFPLTQLGTVKRYLKRPEEAEALLRRAVAIVRAARGKDHTDYAISLLRLGEHLSATENQVEALPAFEEARRVFEAVGKRDSQLSECSRGIGIVHQHLKRRREADAAFRQALETAERALGKDHPQLWSHLANLATSRASLEQWSEAETHYRRALRVLGDYERKSGIKHARAAQLSGDYRRFLEQRGVAVQEVEKRLKSALVE